MLGAPVTLTSDDETADAPQDVLVATDPSGATLVAYLVSPVGGGYDAPATLVVRRLP